MLLFGSLTLLADNPLFIMLKPTFIYVAMAIAIAVALLIGKNPAAALFSSKLSHIPASAWKQMSWQWVWVLAGFALLNLLLAFNVSEGTWVNIRVFGFPILTFAIIATQLVLIVRRYNEEASLD